MYSTKQFVKRSFKDLSESEKKAWFKSKNIPYMCEMEYRIHKKAKNEWMDSGAYIINQMYEEEKNKPTSYYNKKVVENVTGASTCKDVNFTAADFGMDLD